jgi:hypothetical protein
MDKRPRRRQKPNRGRARARTISILGLEVSALGSIVGGSALVLLAGLLIWLFGFTRAGSIFGSRPDTRAVDLFTAVNGVGYTRPGERILQSKTTNIKIPGPSQIVVTRDNPNGRFLIMRVNIPNQLLDEMSKGMAATILPASQIVLQCGDEKLEPLLIQEDGDPHNGFQLSFMPPQSDGPTRELGEYLGPGKDPHNSWTHEGTLERDRSALHFAGRSGMQVRVETGASRQDGRQGGNLLGQALGGDAGKGLDESGLVGAPSAYIRVTWDERSYGCMIGYDLERTSDLRLSWDVYCVFPRPKSNEKAATLLVLGKLRKVKLP